MQIFVTPLDLAFHPPKTLFHPPKFLLNFFPPPKFFYFDFPPPENLRGVKNFHPPKILSLNMYESNATLLHPFSDTYAEYQDIFRDFLEKSQKLSFFCDY